MASANRSTAPYLHPLFNTWRGMMKRCYYKKHRSYCRYGGRGIAVCERWRESFWNFVDDVGVKPSARHSLERIKNDGDYEPGNVKWATRREQQGNRRDTRWITHDGKTQCLGAWCSELRLGYTMIFHRLKRGMSFADAIRKPSQRAHLKAKG